eukprot:CAMPEP_0176446762 /NCGR_PEP_ID=MMETSP0127-20121128/24531_1 /TAXON_ID=938130 /ORGANISM="Platyophrya macrostoma, Strain WH" /LENGTH=116 /DNA_ID=CAMNT_0017832883 /DNA_START=124 /DNA_END=474 /DNA_ORIENTATION=+
MTDLEYDPVALLEISSNDMNEASLEKNEKASITLAQADENDSNDGMNSDGKVQAGKKALWSFLFVMLTMVLLCLGLQWMLSAAKESRKALTNLQKRALGEPVPAEGSIHINFSEVK